LAIFSDIARAHRMALIQNAKLSKNNTSTAKNALPTYTPLSFFTQFPLSEQQCCTRAVGPFHWREATDAQQSSPGVCHFRTNGHKCLSRLILIFALPFSLIGK